MNNVTMAPSKFDKEFPAVTYGEMPALGNAHKNIAGLGVPVVPIPVRKIGAASLPNVMGGLKAPKTKPNYGMAHPVTYKMKTFDDLEYMG